MPRLRTNACKAPPHLKEEGMRNFLILVGLASLLVFAAGCKKKEEPVTPTEEKPAAEAMMEDAKQDVEGMAEEATTATEKAAGEAVEEGKEMAEHAGHEMEHKGHEMVEEVDKSSEKVMEDAEQTMDTKK